MQEKQAASARATHVKRNLKREARSLGADDIDIKSPAGQYRLLVLAARMVLDGEPAADKRAQAIGALIRAALAVRDQVARDEETEMLRARLAEFVGARKRSWIVEGSQPQRNRKPLAIEATATATADAVPTCEPTPSETAPEDGAQDLGVDQDPPGDEGADPSPAYVNQDPPPPDPFGAPDEG